jgi:O-antigen ligase
VKKAVLPQVTGLLSRWPLLWAAVPAAGLALALLPLHWVAIGVPAGISLIALVIWPRYGIYLLCFAVPFGSLFQLSLGPMRVGLTEAVVGLLFASWIARLLAFREAVTWPGLSGPLALFVGATLFSLLNAVAPALAFKEIAKWVEFMGVMAFVANELTHRQKRTAVACLLLAAVAESLLGVYQFLTRSGPEFFVILGRFVRAYGTFEQPNPYAGYLGLVGPLALALGLPLVRPSERPARSDWLCWLGAGSSIVIAIAIGMSWSRGAWIAAAAAIVGVVVASSRRGALALVCLVAVVALAGALGGLGLVPDSIAQRLTSFLPIAEVRDVRAVEVTDANYASVERLAFWQAALDMWRDHPWLGVGLGNYAAAYSAYSLPKWRMALGHAHNYYLNIACETGLVGLLAYLFLWAAAFIQVGLAIRRKGHPFARCIAVGVLGMLVHLTVHNAVDSLWVHGMYIHVAMVLGLVQSSRQ